MIFEPSLEEGAKNFGLSIFFRFLRVKRGHIEIISLEKGDSRE